jgi:hypothetical protein
VEADAHPPSIPRIADVPVRIGEIRELHDTRRAKIAKTDRDLFDTLRARGLRKSAANNLAKAFGRADKSPPSKGAKRAVSELRDIVSDLESRVGRTNRKRSEAAKKAAATRKRKADARSRAAKKAAETRSKRSRVRAK